MKIGGQAMPAQTSVLHVRMDDHLKTNALSGVGLTLSDAVRILLTRVAAEGGLDLKRRIHRGRSTGRLDLRR